MSMFRTLLISTVLVFFFLGGACTKHSKVVVIVPEGTKSVFLLSGGTADVLNLLRSRYKEKAESIEALYNIESLKQKAGEISQSSRSEKKAYNFEVDKIRNHYISKVSVKINSVVPFISPEASAMGELAFTYTARNDSDRIIADVVYIPKIGTIKIQTSSSLVLDFVDRETLKAGLAPGQTLSSTDKDPDRFSFLIGQLSKDDLSYIRENARKEFSIEIKDIHFTNDIEYKDQSKVLTVEQAFASRLSGIRDKKIYETDMAEKVSAQYQKTQKMLDNDIMEARLEFTKAAEDLKKSAIRYSTEADNKGRAAFSNVAPGKYYIYALISDQAVFKEISIGRTDIKDKALSLIKDPFLP